MNSGVIGTNGRTVAGLYAAGELAGGIQCDNSLGGSSPLVLVLAKVFYDNSGAA